MDLRKVIVLVFVVSALCCDIPQTFTTQFQTTILSPSLCLAVGQGGSIYYDASSQSARVDESIFQNGLYKTYTFLYLYSQGIQYVVDRDVGTCSSSKLTTAFPNLIIPSGSTEIETITIGSQSVSVFAVPDTTQVGYQSTLSVTQDYCYLVSQTAYNETTGNVYFQQNFWNFNTNVPQNAFAVPSQCSTEYKIEIVYEEEKRSPGFNHLHNLHHCDE